MNRLRLAREQRGISQRDLGKAMGVSAATISRYETMEREADYETLIKFADYFDVSLDYLLGRTDDLSKK